MSNLRKDSSTIEVEIKDLGIYSVVRGTTLGELADSLQDEVTYPVVGGIIHNTMRDLSRRLEEDTTMEFVNLNGEDGAGIYRRSAAFLLIKACRDEFPDRKIMIKHTLSNGLYCEFVGYECTASDVEQIKARMVDLIQKDLMIRRSLMSRREAEEIFISQEQIDKTQILAARGRKNAHVYELDGFYEYFYGHMVHRTGVLDRFDLLYYTPGMVLQTPRKGDQGQIQEYHEQPKLAAIYQEAKQWADMLELPTLSALNAMIDAGNIDDVIRVNEALHEKKIAHIADKICSDPNIRVVLISGPSSSGKTTFAQRLLIQLRVNGRKPVSISLDNYFIDKVKTPLDEDGDYDFEAIEALKLDLFNEHLGQLIDGEEVELPVYNFKNGTCETKGLLMKVPEGEPIIIEGIHGLNDRLTWSIPTEQKFKIYISALTQLNIDRSNRIPTTDSRLLRRIIRDSRTRGYEALDTIKRWPSVRRGEEKNIFPFQENADIMFNSSLMYELAVLKPIAEPLLEQITPDSREYIEARRLLKFLSYFHAVPTTSIPPNSILREFVGDSWFRT